MPRLILVPTPIGNLEDISLRALRVLQETPTLLAEDTRRTRKLLSHYGISKFVTSYHQHNERSRIEEILRTLEKQDVALVSDAGMPGVSDPGFELVRAALRAGVEVDVLPGPSAVTTAVVAAALPGQGFTFLGFLPRRSAERRRKLESLIDTPFLLVFYEAPHRLIASLRDVQAVLGSRDAAVCRELSKLHQEVARGCLGELIERFSQAPVKGECTVVVAPRGEKQDRSPDAVEELRRKLSAGQERRVAIAEVSRQFSVSRNRLYQASLRFTNSKHAAQDRDEIDHNDRSHQGA